MHKVDTLTVLMRYVMTLGLFFHLRLLPLGCARKRKVPVILRDNWNPVIPKDNWNPVVPKDNWDSTFPDRGKTGQKSGKYECNNFDQNEIKIV